jgi:murein tripeptide amidase MpaA
MTLAASGCGSSGSTSGVFGRDPQPLSVYPPADLASIRPQTRAERSSFTETSTYADVMAFIDSLKGSPHVHVTTMGRSTQGRDIPLLVVSRPRVRTPAEAKRTNRPIVYIQGNIHGGEVEGKEALLSLIRDLTRDQYANVLDSVVILAGPIYNIDGNDSFGPQERNRGAQNGPASIGQRPNGQNLDLNRDYMKAEAPETRASLELFTAWDPDVLVDLHTTNGSYHGYGLTYANPLNPAALFTLAFTRDTVLPLLRERLRDRVRVETFPYGNFGRDSIWATYDHRPRFGTNYYGLRGRVAILSEAYSHDPFRKRVASTYAFVSELLHIIGTNGEDFIEAGREADRRTTAFASTGSGSPPIAIRSRVTATPRIEEMILEEVIRTPGDSTRYEAGLRLGERRTGKTFRKKMPVSDRFDATLTQTLPFAWVIPAEQSALLEHLRRHGVFVEQVAGAPATVSARSFMVDSVVKAATPFQGHQEVRLAGQWQAAAPLTIDGTAYIVRAGQPLAILALYLLEPQSDDGLVTWNFLDQWLRPGERYPIARVVERITVPLRPVR